MKTLSPLFSILMITIVCAAADEGTPQRIAPGPRPRLGLSQAAEGGEDFKADSRRRPCGIIETLRCPVLAKKIESIFMIGKTLNHVIILDHPGKGGVREVYVAEDSKLKRRVALKVSG